MQLSNAYYFSNVFVVTSALIYANLQRWVVTSYIYSVTFTWVTFQKNILLRVVLLCHTFYFYLSRSVKQKRYSYSVTLGYTRLITFLFTTLNMLYCAEEMPPVDLPHDCVSPIRRSNNNHVTPFHQMSPCSHMTSYELWRLSSTNSTHVADKE